MRQNDFIFKLNSFEIEIYNDYLDKVACYNLEFHPLNQCRSTHHVEEAEGHMSDFSLGDHQHKR